MSDDILTRAAKLIEERGWCQDVSVDDQGRVCAIGAISIAAQQANDEKDNEEWPSWWADRCDAIIKLQRAIFGTDYEALAAPLDTPYERFIPEWNDAPGRTAEDVLLAFKRAAHEES